MRLAKSSLIYLGSSILNKSIPLLMLPILTHYLAPEEFGMISLFQIFVTFFVAIIGMAMQTNITINFFKIKKPDLAVLIGNIIMILSVNLLIAFVIFLFCFIFGFKNIFGLPIFSINFAILISFFLVIIECGTTILRCRSLAFAYGKVEISTAIMCALLILISLIVFKQGWKSQIYGMAISSIIMASFVFKFLKNHSYIIFKCSRIVIKDILKVSIPLIPHIIGGIIISMSDRLFIEKMVGLDEVGIYSVGYMFGMVIVLFVDAFIKAWSPWFYKNLSQLNESKKNKIVRYIYLYIVSVVLFSIILSIIAKFILPFVTNQAYFKAQDYVLWISLGYAMQGIYKIFFPFLVFLKKTHYLAISTTIAALLNLILNYYFILYFGTVGAAYATIIAFLVSALLVFVIQKHFYKMPWIKGILNG